MATILPDPPSPTDSEPARPYPGSEPLVFPGGRDRSIPISALDLGRILLDQPGLAPAERLGLQRFERLLADILHQSFHSWLNELKDRYAPIDPDGFEDGRRYRVGRLDETTDDEFLNSFEAALIRANYQKLNSGHLQAAVAAPNGIGLDYTPNFAMFEHLNVYVRGRCQLRRKLRLYKNFFRPEDRTFEAYRRVVIVLKFVPGAVLDDYMRSDVVYLRMYRDVPFAEMDLHLPEQGTRIRMRWFDRAQIASPLVTGLPALAMKVVGTLGLGFSPLFLATLLAIPVGAGIKSFFGFRQTKSRYLHFMIRHLYYLTQANNSSVIARLIDSAEEEEFKEALLAYFLLLRVGADDPPWEPERLDREVETFLKDHLQIDTDFEINDAVAKLRRLGLIHERGDGRLTAVGLDQALVRLDDQWDNLYNYANRRVRTEDSC